MKRDPFDIVQRILKTIEEENRPLSINELSKETGMHNITVRKYVRIIEYVRREPSVEVIKTKHSIILRIKK